MAKKLGYEYCRAVPILEWLGNEWTLVVLVKISGNGPVRFNELYRNIPVGIGENTVASSQTVDHRRHNPPRGVPGCASTDGKLGDGLRQNAFAARRSIDQLGTR